MTATQSPVDLLLFETAPDALFDGLRDAGQGGSSSSTTEFALLSEIGLIGQDGQLTAAGRRIYLSRWVTDDRKKALIELGQALRTLLPVQVLEQELRGFGAVPEDGVLNLLLLHRGAPLSMTVDSARKIFMWLNDVGVVAFDRKRKTVRSLAPPADAPLAGEDRSLAAMVSPNRPFSNVVRLRRILRSLRGTVYWADPHFSRRAFEELVTELDVESVKGIRIISGGDPSVLTDRSFEDFKRFRAEMAGAGVDAEWRVDQGRDWHDRWLVDDVGGYNMPPTNTLFKGDYSEMLPVSERPPVEEWWNRSEERQD